MPVGTILTTLAIGGRLNSSFGASISGAGRQLLGLQRRAGQTGLSLSSLSRQFLRMSATVFVFDRMIKGLEGMGKAAREETGYIENLNTSLSRNKFVRAEGLGAAQKYTKEIKAQSIELQRQTGIYQGVFEKQAMTLAATGASGKAIERLLPLFADMSAFQKNKGGTGDMNAIASGFGTAVVTGQARSLKEVDVLLSPAQRKMMAANADLGDLGRKANADFLYKFMQDHFGGSAARRMQTVPGRVEASQSAITSMLKPLGALAEEIIPKLNFFFLKIVPVFIPPIIAIFKELNKGLDFMLKMVDQYGIPLLKRWVREGWENVNKAVKYFKDNSGWIVPWAKRLAIDIGALIVTIRVMAGIIGLVALALNPVAWAFGIVAVAGVVAADQVIQHWTEVKSFLDKIWESIAGTKVADPLNKGFGYTKKFAKGVVPRAMPVEEGWIANMKKTWDNAIKWIQVQWNKLFDSFDPETKRAFNNISKHWQEMCDAIAKVWNKNVWPSLEPMLGWAKTIGTYVAGFFGVAFKQDLEFFIQTIDRALIIVKSIAETYGKIDDWVKSITGRQDHSNDFMGGGSGATGTGGSGGWSGNSTPGYGIGAGKDISAYYDQFDASGKKYGIDPKLLRSIAMQEGVDPRDMNPLGISPHGGGPTHFATMPDAMAGIDRQVRLMADGIHHNRGPYAGVKNIDDLARVYSPVGAGNDPKKTNATEGAGIKASMRKQGVKGDGVNAQEIHVHYTDASTIHGADASTLAAHHRNRIESLKKAVAEVMYEHNRRAFSSAT